MSLQIPEFTLRERFFAYFILKIWFQEWTLLNAFSFIGLLNMYGSVISQIFHCNSQKFVSCDCIRVINSKFVKLLQAQVGSVNFTYFLIYILFGGSFAIWSKCAFHRRRWRVFSAAAADFKGRETSTSSLVFVPRAGGALPIESISSSHQMRAWSYKKSSDLVPWYEKIKWKQTGGF